MTETIDRTTLEQALELIDRGLSDMQAREIVSTAEVSDLLLDLRLLLAIDAAESVTLAT